jgi:hypothetical protein
MVSIWHGRQFRPVRALLSWFLRPQENSENILWAFGAHLACFSVFDVLSVSSERDQGCNHQHLKPSSQMISEFSLHVTFMLHLCKILYSFYLLFNHVSINNNASIFSYAFFYQINVFKYYELCFKWNSDCPRTNQAFKLYFSHSINKIVY